MESTWPSMPSFKIDPLWPHFLKTFPMDTTLSKVPETVVPYVMHLASKNGIKLRAELSILKIRWNKFSTFLFTIFWTLSILKKGYPIEFKYYADAIHSDLTPSG